jgi:hypothetical protein
VNEKPEVNVTRGELYVLVLQTFLFIGALAAAVLGVAPELRSHVRTPVGVGIATFIVALLVLPMQRILVRTYYRREVPVTGSVLSALAASAMVFGGWWIVQNL